jgi:hypothetical protein
MFYTISDLNLYDSIIFIYFYMTITIPILCLDTVIILRRGLETSDRGQRSGVI